MKTGLPEEYQFVCYGAISKLEDICQKLLSGDISVLELQKIQKAQLAMKRLCAAAEVKDKSKKTRYYASYDVIDRVMKQKLKEYEAFRNQQKYLLHLCRRIGDAIGEVFNYIGMRVVLAVEECMPKC